MNRYFTIVDQNLLDSTLLSLIENLNKIIPPELGVTANDIFTSLGYGEDDHGLLFSDIIQIIRELNDGNFAISVQLCPKFFLENKCVYNNIKPYELELAKLQYGEDNLLTLDQFKELDFKTE